MEKIFNLELCVMYYHQNLKQGEEGGRGHLTYHGADGNANIFRSQNLEKIGTWKMAVDGGYNYNAQ
jgi:hypothetical protein